MAMKVGVVILAAGLGKRMKSNKAKVLHELCEFPMIHYVMRTATAVAGANIVVVIGHQAEQVQKTVSDSFEARFALQSEQLGTGHAVQCALPYIPDSVENVVILCGDVPLIQKATIIELLENHCEYRRDVTVYAVTVQNPTGYGRILFDRQNHMIGIIEEADADDVQKKNNVINSGIYAIKRSFLETVLPQIKSDNAQNEIYLTDIIKIGYQQNKKMGALIGDDSDEVMGVNSCNELEIAEKAMKKRLS